MLLESLVLVSSQLERLLLIFAIIFTRIGFFSFSIFFLFFFFPFPSLPPRICDCVEYVGYSLLALLL